MFGLIQMAASFNIDLYALENFEKLMNDNSLIFSGSNIERNLVGFLDKVPAAKWVTIVNSFTSRNQNL